MVAGDFDACLRLAREASEALGITLLNSINPWRIEGQKTIVLEMLQQRGWNAPDWIAVPAGNLGNTAAFGKALREARPASVRQFFGLASLQMRRVLLDLVRAAKRGGPVVNEGSGQFDTPDSTDGHSESDLVTDLYAAIDTLDDDLKEVVMGPSPILKPWKKTGYRRAPR